MKATGYKPYTPKLTEEQVREIRRDYKPREVTLRMLAERHHVSINCIHHIVYPFGDKRTWKHLD